MLVFSLRFIPKDRNGDRFGGEKGRREGGKMKQRSISFVSRKGRDECEMEFSISKPIWKNLTSNMKSDISPSLLVATLLD